MRSPRVVRRGQPEESLLRDPNWSSRAPARSPFVNRACCGRASPVAPQDAAFKVTRPQTEATDVDFLTPRGGYVREKRKERRRERRLFCRFKYWHREQLTLVSCLMLDSSSLRHKIRKYSPRPLHMSSSTSCLEPLALGHALYIDVLPRRKVPCGDARTHLLGRCSAQGIR